MTDQSEQKQIILFFFLILYGLTHIHTSFIHSFDDGGMFVGGLVHTLSPRYTIEIHSTESHLRALKMGASGAFKEANHKQTNKQNETNNTRNDAVETTIDKFRAPKLSQPKFPSTITLHCCCCCC